MGRWAPDAAVRLLEAAMELFSEHGFEQTTVAEIANRAGLTERTFYRYFEDKREVLFKGGEMLQELLVTTLDNAPTSDSPLEAVRRAFEAVNEFFPDRGSYYRRRYDVIAANPELQERERVKLAAIAKALSLALQRRGVKESVATLTAEMGGAVFRVAFERWIAENHEHDLAHYMRESFDELVAVSATRSGIGERT